MDKKDPKYHSADPAEKDPENWVSADDPMTGAQASYLKTLAAQEHDPEAYDEDSSKAKASKRIDALKTKLELE